MTTKSFVLIVSFILHCLLQAIARGVGAGVDDSVSLDVHAINELKDKGFAATDDSSKYHYTADNTGHYSELMLTCHIITQPEGAVTQPDCCHYYNNVCIVLAK